MSLRRGVAAVAVLGLGAVLLLALLPAPTRAPRRLEPGAGPTTVAEDRAGAAAAHDHGPPMESAHMAFTPEEGGPVPTRFLVAQEPVTRPTAAPPRADGPVSVAVTHGDRTRMRVALTFDAGADTGYAADILDTLARERVVAAFGMTGGWAERNPDLVRRIAAEGHGFINHTWSHDSFTGLSTGRGAMTREQRWSELDRTEAIIQRLAGATTLPYFRPPYGDTDASVLADAGARGYAVTAMWAVDSAGWNGLSAPRITDRTLRLTSPGAIVIFHVGSQSQDAAALPAIIRGLREAGYEFVSVDALLGR